MLHLLSRLRVNDGIIPILEQSETLRQQERGATLAPQDSQKEKN
jgi:hypothetical protein